VDEICFASVVQHRQAMLADGGPGSAFHHLSSVQSRVLGVAHLCAAGREERLVQLVRRGDVPQRLDRIGITFRDKLGARQVEPETFGVLGIEAHRLADPFDALLALAEPSHDFVLLDHIAPTLFCLS
jgi:hypothetical protein